MEWLRKEGTFLTSSFGLPMVVSNGLAAELVEDPRSLFVRQVRGLLKDASGAATIGAVARMCAAGVSTPVHLEFTSFCEQIDLVVERAYLRLAPMGDARRKAPVTSG
jgi:hypothetical protein